MPRLPMIDGSLKPVSTTIGASPPVMRKPNVGTSCRRPGSCARTRKLVSSSMSPRSRTFTSRPMSSPLVRWDRRRVWPAPGPGAIARSDDAQQPRGVDRLRARRDVELAEEVTPMRLRRRLGDAERERDLLEAQPGLQRTEHLVLARAQVRGGGRRARHEVRREDRADVDEVADGFG